MKKKNVSWNAFVERVLASLDKISKHFEPAKVQAPKPEEAEAYKKILITGSSNHIKPFRWAIVIGILFFVFLFWPRVEVLVDGSSLNINAGRVSYEIKNQTTYPGLDSIGSNKDTIKLKNDVTTLKKDDVKSKDSSVEKLKQYCKDLEKGQLDERFRVAHRFVNTVLIGRYILLICCIGIIGFLIFTFIKANAESKDSRF